MNQISRQLLKNIRWLAAAAVITIIFGTIAVTAQQTMRWSADDPQVQLAKDVANGLNLGQTPGELVDGHVDIGTSLAPFVIVYDRSGQIVTGSGYLGGVVPQIPKGVLDHSRSVEYNRITWQPQSDTRIASVTVAADNYYVVSGRSLREVERRIKYTLLLVLFGWIFAIACLYAAAWWHPGMNRPSLRRLTRRSRAGRTKK